MSDPAERRRIGAPRLARPWWRIACFMAALSCSWVASQTLTPSAGGSDGPVYLTTTGSATLGGLAIEDEDVAEYDADTDVATEFFDGNAEFSGNEDLDAIHIQSDGKLLLSTQNGAAIGSLSVADEDVFEYDPSTGAATMIFDGSAIIGGGEDIDAVSRLSNGNLVLSTNNQATLSGLTFQDEDLVEYDPLFGTATLLFDGSEVFADNEDIDAVHVKADGKILISTEGDGVIGSLVFGDDDLVEYDPETGTATIYFNGGDTFANNNEDINGASLVGAEPTSFFANWRLDETSGAIASDNESGDFEGAYENGVTFNTTGPYPDDGGIASEFDGNDDRVVLPTINADFATGFTATFWMRPNETPDVEAAMLGLSSGIGANEIWIGWSAGNGLRVMLTDTIDAGATRTLDDGIEPAVGEWRHVAVTIDTTGNATIYRDGEPVSSGYVSLPDAAARDENYIGQSVADDHFSGRMFDVRVYNRALNAAAISTIYGLVGHWRFDEGTGTTAADSSGFANDAEFNNGLPVWITGQAGGALEFDGSSDAQTNANFSPPDYGAAAFWFRSDGPSSQHRLWGLHNDYEVRQGNNGVIVFDLLADGNRGGFRTDEPLHTAGQWYHLVAQYDAETEAFEIYIDGVLHKSGVSTRDLRSENANELSFGTRTGSSQRFTGALDDARIYNRWLTVEEIAALAGLNGSSGLRITRWTEVATP